jgi:hypothetical protein
LTATGADLAAGVISYRDAWIISKVMEMIRKSAAAEARRMAEDQMRIWAVYLISEPLRTPL